MKMIFCTIVICLLITPTFAGIKLPANCEIGLPSVLLKKTVKESEVNTLVKSGNWGQASKSDRYWIVYSDRSHNTTYNSPSTSSGKCDELDFNEQIRIAKIENGFALVYTENQKGVIYPLISTNAESRGWIPMSNLLLWGSCPTNEAGIYNKAILTINEDNKGNTDIGRCYKNPLTKDMPQSVFSENLNFFFVMKKADNGFVLLSRECKMEGYTNAVLYGWVSPDSYIIWNGRTCIEPNWKPSVAEELKGKKISVNVVGRNPIVVELGIQNNITQEPTKKYRWEPIKIRYPLLGNNPNNEKQYSIIVIGRRLPGILDNSMVMASYGFTDKKDRNTGLDYWQPVILISSDEFAQLMEKLQPVMSAASTGNRKPYVDAMKELTRSMIPDITPKEMDEKDVKEIMALVAGLNVKSGSLGGRTLIQIQDENVVNQEEFDGMIDDFRIKYKNLKKIRENKYDFSIERNRTTWYWLPVEDLP